MSNAEKFNAILNSCHNPDAVYAALLALTEAVFIKMELKEEDAT